MTEEELQKNSEHWYNLYKQTKKQLEEIKANADYQIEGRDLEIKELREQLKEQTNFAKTYYEEIIKLHEQIESKDKFIADLEESNNAGSDYISNLENQIEKMKNNWNCKDIGNCIYSRCPCEHWKLKE